jgi:hypothetical protein
VAILQIQTVTENDPAAGMGLDLKIETTQNKLHTVAGYISKILV